MTGDCDKNVRNTREKNTRKTLTIYMHDTERYKIVNNYIDLSFRIYKLYFFDCIHTHFTLQKLSLIRLFIADRYEWFRSPCNAPIAHLLTDIYDKQWNRCHNGNRYRNDCCQIGFWLIQRHTQYKYSDAGILNARINGNGQRITGILPEQFRNQPTASVSNPWQCKSGYNNLKQSISIRFAKLINFTHGLTSQENSLKRYKFVTMANITMNTISKADNVFRIRVKNLAALGKYRWISNPIVNGIIKAMMYVNSVLYGTRKFPLSNIVLPSVNSHNGIIPNAAIVLMVVIAMDISILPPSKIVQMFEAPPPGETPVKKRPNCMETSCRKISKPRM